MKSSLEITLKSGVDPFKVQDHLKQYTGIKCHVVDFSTVRVYYNPNKTQEKMILKLIQKATAPDHRKRKLNTQSIKSIQDV